MQTFAALSMLLIGVVTLVVGARLLLLARRSRRLPELAFGIGFLSASLGTIGAQLGQRLLWTGGGPLAAAANGACFALAVLGTVMVYVAVRRIFRPRDGWAAWACALGSGLALLGWVWRAAAGDLPEGRLDGTGMAIFQTSRLLLFAWAAGEALHHYGQLTRRLRIGLADPVAATQILLWGVTGLALMATTAIILVSIFWIGRHPLDLPLATGLLTLLTVIASGLMWCAFFPPEALRRQALARAASA